MAEVVSIDRTNAIVALPESGYAGEEAIAGLLPDSSVLPTQRPDYVDSLIPTSFDAIYAVRDRLRYYRARFPRSNEVQQAYDLWRVDLLQYGLSIDMYAADYILKERDMVFTANAFPSVIPEDTIHGIIWFGDYVTKDQKIDWLKQFMEEYSLTPQDIVLVQNPEFGRSVTDVSHYQAFLRKTPELQAWQAKQQA